MNSNAPLPTVKDILPAGMWDGATASDSIVLDYDERHRRRFSYTGAGGTRFLLDLPRPRLLHDGDGLRLSDGSMIHVRAADEPLMEARAASPHALLRLAWHIGNRHLPAQITPDAIRLRHDHVIRDMLIGLGAEVTAIHAPFTPEQGAYAAASTGHGHHGHDHGHDHGDGHGHGHGHHHDHGHHDHAH
ncbi:MAG TPA: urease accessory protein UreE [Croceibacterium sp.]|nr:urease accessory protein UreE [Croceibacterium sp.]